MWWEFWRRQRRERLSPSAQEFDAAFIISEYNRGWVLETICKKIADHWGASTSFVWTKRNRKITASIPSARVYWFSHFQLLITALEQHPEIRQGRLMVWFTHPSKPEISEAQLVHALNQCHAVIFTCSIHRDAMVAKGVNPSIAHVVLGAADADVFYVDRNAKRDAFGFVSAYYERKNPELMEAIIEAHPEQKFILVGPKADSMGKTDRMWSNYPHFQRMIALGNLEYVESDYQDYPLHYNRMKALLSTSQLEGGPISVVEAMMCGCVPIMTDTGFARDIVSKYGLGCVLSLDAGVEEWTEAMCAVPERSRKIMVESLSWKQFAKTIYHLSFES